MLLRRLDVGGELGGSGCLYMRAINEVSHAFLCLAGTVLFLRNAPVVRS